MRCFKFIAESDISSPRNVIVLLVRALGTLGRSLRRIVGIYGFREFFVRSENGLIVDFLRGLQLHLLDDELASREPGRHGLS